MCRQRQPGCSPHVDSSFIPIRGAIKNNVKDNFLVASLCVYKKSKYVKQVKFLVSSVRLLDLRLVGICFWTEEGNISIKFPLICKTETSAQVLSQAISDCRQQEAGLRLISFLPSTVNAIASNMKHNKKVYRIQAKPARKYKTQTWKKSIIEKTVNSFQTSNVLLLK